MNRIIEKRTFRFLRYSLAIILILCVAIFVWMTHFMLQKNEKTMNTVCEIYTSEMSYQLEKHFASVVDLRFAMVQGIIKRTPPDSFTEYGQKMIDELEVGGKIRNFTYLALYSEDGNMDVIYGEPMKIINETSFRSALKNNEKKLISGVTQSGDVLMLLGLKASYPMKNGQKSAALMAGLPIEYLNFAMSLGEDETLVYSHVIRKDGSYVLHNDNNHMDNYFEWLLKVPAYKGKTRQEILNELQDAISKGNEYSMIATVDGQRRNVYFVPLKNSEWYLVTVLLYGTLDETVAELGNAHLFASLVTCSTILLMLSLLFISYRYISGWQLKELKRQKQRADRANLAKSEFLSNMSHDIRTPMNGIVGMTAIAIANINNTKIVQDALHKITLSSKHLLGLINDVLDMSKIETGKLSIHSEQVSLRELMESVVNIIQPQIKTKNQNFDIFTKDIQCENVYSDSIRLNQILINLLSNAVKYTQEGGSIYVTLSQEDSPKGKNYVRTHIRVEDNGIGMSEEFQERIFISFVREDSKRVKQVEGTGLGMAITKYIVDAMNGTIELRSELDKGSEFHITLDFERISADDKNMVLPAWELLLVDDDEQLCRVAVDTLNEIGIHAEWALNGPKAIQMAVERYNQHRDYHVVLLDWNMPDMNGIETARQLRRHLGDNVPILLISAYDWSDIENEAREAGINGFICKPLFKSTLYHELEHFMNEDNQSEEPTKESRLDFTGKHLLLAEDYDMNWEICRELLSVYGFELDWAENGQICVDKFNASEPGFYDAVLMDLRMPVMDGYQATSLIRSSGRTDADVPIIAMTADAFSEDVQRCLDCGMNNHVAKPIDIPRLLRILQTYIK